MAAERSAIDPGSLLVLAIRPALDQLGMGGEDARALLLGTAAVESGLRHWRQLGGGPALGLWQMEPATHTDIWRHWLRYRPEVRTALAPLIPREIELRQTLYPKDVEGLGKLLKEPRAVVYTAAMARIHYRRVSEPLPAADDLEAQARYWKQHYNTHQGAGTVEHYLAAGAGLSAGSGGLS